MIKGFTVEDIVESLDNFKLAHILKDNRLDYYWCSSELKRAAQGRETAESILYAILSDACSMCIVKGGLNYDAHIKLCTGARSAILQDFTGETARVLLGIFGKIENPLLKARISDVLWLNRKLTKFEKPLRFATAALDGYCAISVSVNDLEHGSRKIFERAIALALSLKKSGEIYLNKLRAKLIDICKASYNNLKNNAMIHASSIIFHSNLPMEEEDLTKLLGLLECYVHQDGLHMFKVNDGYDLLIDWCGRLARKNDVDRCLFEKAEFNRRIGDQMRNEQADFGIVSGRYEDAQRCYDKLPRRFKQAHNVQSAVRELRKSLNGVRQDMCANMQHFRSKPIDLRKQIGVAKRKVQGLDLESAIFKFSLMEHLQEKTIRRNVMAILKKSPLVACFPLDTYDNGNLVSRVDGLDFGDPNFEKSDRFQQLMVRQFDIIMQLVWNGSLWPAFCTILTEHKIDKEFCYSLCASSRSVPKNRVKMFGRGLLTGFEQDFQTAAALLIPQIENAVRQLLKACGEETILHDSVTEIDSELGLSRLVTDDEKMHTILGDDLAFEMKVMFGPSPNYNLRNQYAHGMVDDSEGISMYDFLIWRLALRLVVYGCADKPEKFGLKLPAYNE